MRNETFRRSIRRRRPLPSPRHVQRQRLHSRYSQKDAACSKPFSPSEFRGNQAVDCDALAQLCNNGNACLLARGDVQQCFRGGDPRHIAEYRTVEGVVRECEALLKEKREKKLCR